MSSSLRSISLPARLKAAPSSACLVLEEEVKRVKAGLEEEVGISLSTGWIQSQVLALSDLYTAYTEQMRMSMRIGVVVVDDDHDIVSLVSTCNWCRELVSSLKDQVWELHSALRRRRGSPHSQAAAAASYLAFRSKCNKEVAKCAKELTRTQRSFHNSGLSAQVASLSVATLHSLLSLLHSSSSPNSKNKNKNKTRSIISRVLHLPMPMPMPMPMLMTTKAVRENEIESVDCTLRVILTTKDSHVLMEEALKTRLRALDAACHTLEDALEALFRTLVQHRVSILNILTHS